MADKMTGVVLPGNSTVEFREYDIPEPGYGQVLLRTKASTICGSDIRAIYRQHVGKGPEGYQGVIAGHEPAGQIIETGPGMKRFKEGDRVVVYHISGCGLCYDCRRGYMISCTSPLRAAYGWQRDGGMADYILADEKDLVLLPDSLSFIDGAQVACGFGTCYEALEKVGICGNDVVLVTGLGPVGLATLMLCRQLGARKLIGVDIVPERIGLAREMGLVDHALTFDDRLEETVLDLTDGHGCERSVDCSGNPEAREMAIRLTRAFGRIVLVGEGNTVTFEPSPLLLHGQKTLYGSWVTSIWRMEDLVERLAAWDVHPHDLVTDRFPLEKADDAYSLMAEGRCGKVAVAFDEELG